MYVCSNVYLFLLMFTPRYLLRGKRVTLWALETPWTVSVGASMILTIYVFRFYHNAKCFSKLSDAIHRIIHGKC